MGDLARARLVLENALTKTGARAATLADDVLPVHSALAPLFPSGGLKRGTVAGIHRSTSLLLGVIATAARDGAWLAVVGMPDLGLLAATEWGIDLDHVALIPEPGTESAVVIGALLDGVDIVALGPDTPLTDDDRRRLAARARERGAVLISQPAWPGADVVLTAETRGWEGVSDGEGYFTSMALRINRSGRASAAVPMHTEVRFGADITVLTPARVGGMPVQPPRPAPAPSTRRLRRQQRNGGLELVG